MAAGIRRTMICVLGAMLLAPGPVSRASSDRADPPQVVPPAVIQVTDLYRPYADPDDHWDLASVYALASRKEIVLKAIVIDFPPERTPALNPDLIAVAQMNHITGLSVPVATGTPRKLASATDTQPDASSSDLAGVRLIIDVLRSSATPVVINILGSSRDVVIAGNREPALFAKKCAAIYLNAGAGTHNKALLDGRKEYNVRLDEAGYAAVFNLPCPVYWLPCFEDNSRIDGQRPVKPYGSYYKFLHQDVLPALSSRVQNYFTYMYRKTPGPYWLTALSDQADQAMADEVNPTFRSMWCTAGFLHLAGKTATADGRMIPLGQGKESGVFSFDPIRVKGDNDGNTEWEDDPTSRTRFILHVRDVEHYQAAMTSALRTLIQELK